MSDKELFAMDADRVAQRALELHERASMPLSEALALAINEAAPGPIWPIARLFIDSAGNVCSDSHLYAPGLPEGEHDVYPLPVDSGARPAIQASGNHDWVAQVVSSGPHAFPLLQWRSADVSLSTPIGTKLYAAALSSNIKEEKNG